MKDDAADHLLRDVGHHGEDDGHDISIVAPTNNQRNEYHREHFYKTEKSTFNYVSRDPTKFK